MSDWIIFVNMAPEQEEIDSIQSSFRLQPGDKVKVCGVDGTVRAVRFVVRDGDLHQEAMLEGAFV